MSLLLRSSTFLHMHYSIQEFLKLTTLAKQPICHVPQFTWTFVRKRTNPSFEKTKRKLMPNVRQTTREFPLIIM
jgi:hypothetical protein